MCVVCVCVCVCVFDAGEAPGKAEPGWCNVGGYHEKQNGSTTLPPPVSSARIRYLGGKRLNGYC